MVLGAYLFISFTFTCQHDQLVGVCSGRLRKGGGVLVRAQLQGGGVLGAGPTRKRGILCAGQVKKGSLPRHIPILNIYVSTTYNPPPPELVTSDTVLNYTWPLLN